MEARKAKKARKVVEMPIDADAVTRCRGRSCVRRRSLFRIGYAEEEELVVFGDVRGGGTGRRWGGSCWRVKVW